MIFRVLYEKYFMLSFYVAQGMCNECVEDRGGLQCSASDTTNLYIGDLIMLLLFMYFLRRG